MLSVIKNYHCIKPLPDKLIYKRAVYTAMHAMQEEFVIFSTKKMKKGGAYIVCHKSTLVLREDYKGQSLAIDYIVSNPAEHGFGKALIQFAKTIVNRTVAMAMYF